MLRGLVARNGIQRGEKDMKGREGGGGEKWGGDRRMSGVGKGRILP